MTRSARNRATSAALRIADSIPTLAVLRSYNREGAFTGDGARKFAQGFADPDLMSEVHWDLCGERLNARVWAYFFDDTAGGAQ